MKKVFFTLAAVMAVLMLAVGCSAPKAAGSSVSLDIPATWDKIENGVELNMMQALDETTLPAMYPELDLTKVAAYSVHMAMINIRAEEIAIVEAKSAQDVESVKKALEARLAALDQQWSQYLPDQYEFVKAASVKTNGNYVYLAVGENAEAIEKIITDSFTTK
ncbi:MAG: DUF4358 domain-containing protein [Eubacteriales bacterium]|nr:DUF4358 domain-containing protein [Eubacteriales bacterium]